MWREVTVSPPCLLGVLRAERVVVDAPGQQQTQRRLSTALPPVRRGRAGP